MPRLNEVTVWPPAKAVSTKAGPKNNVPPSTRMRLGGVAAKRQGLRAGAIPADTERQFLTNVLRCINEPSVGLASPALQDVKLSETGSQSKHGSVVSSLGRLRQRPLDGAADLSPPLFRIRPRRRRRFMGIEQRQCLPAILDGKLLLPIGQVSIGKIGKCIGGIGISQQVQLEDLDRVFCVARALVILSYDVNSNFRPQLRLRIFAPGVQQLLRDQGGAAG